jgi:hypothetical protein
VSDLPSPDWYTDPEDPAQYRYWDGSEWTGYRAPRDSAGSGHRGIRSLLAGSWRLFTTNWRPFVAVHAVAAVIYFAGEQLVRVGFGNVFGDTITALLDDLETLDPDSEDAGAVLEDGLNDVRGRVTGLNSSALGSGVLLMAIGGLVAVAVNIVQFAAFGHLVMRRLVHQPATAVTALLAGLRRLPRIVGVLLMLLVMFSAACMLASLLVGVLAVVSGPLRAQVGVLLLLGAEAGVLLLLVAVAAVVLATPLVVVTLMTAAVGPAEPSMRYARSLLRGSYRAALGRTVLVLFLSAASVIVLTLIAILVGSFAAPLETVTLYVLGVLPEAFTIALFTVYHDLGGEHAEVAAPAD